MTAGGGALAAALAAYSLSVAPWGLAYYNPALGGGDTAVDTVLVGWWEGLEQVGQVIAERERGHCDDVNIQGPGTSLVYPCGRVRGRDEADYVVLYVERVAAVARGEPGAGGRPAAAGDGARAGHHLRGAVRPSPGRRGYRRPVIGELTLLPPAVPGGARADGRRRGGRQQSAGSVLDRHEAQVVPELVRASEPPIGQLPEEFDHCRAGTH